MLYLYNSQNRKKEKFVPLNDKKVKIYVCGITPYDTTHLGHAFTYVFFDVLIRYLQFKGYDVTYTQNVTDIDDDILRRAKEEKRDWKELGDFWTGKFLSDLKSLNVLPPTHFVKATGSIVTIVEIVKLLIDKKFAYEKNGNVYFAINRFKSYGDLSMFNRRQMVLISKERGGNPDDPLKKDPLDFLLWQISKPEEPFWLSPWSKGRPGWHIECSAMIKKYLGNQIDIHGGGRDLIFPHHENEIAQSESYTNIKPFVKFWIHTAMLLYLGEKMAKSLGNLVMVSDLLKNNTANEIRWLLLSQHYRKPWEFEENELNLVKKKFLKVQQAVNHLTTSDDRQEKLNFPWTKNPYFKKFVSIMDNDLDTPHTLEFIVDLAKTKVSKQILLRCLSILGFVS